MAKALTFELEQGSYSCELFKLERTKLYGSKILEAKTSEGQICQKQDLDEEGFFIPSGATCYLCLDIKGNLHEKEEYTPVDKEQNPLTPVPSSFEAPLPLSQKVSYEEYLNHDIDTVYILQNPEAKMLEIISNSKEIYTFPFNYYSSLDPAQAFLIENKGTLFMLVGRPQAFEYLKLDSPFEEVEEQVMEDDAELDFSMM